MQSDKMVVFMKMKRRKFNSELDTVNVFPPLGWEF